MKVSFNPQSQPFKSKALTNTTEVAHYLTALAEKRPLNQADILDLTETVAKTEKTGIRIAIQSLKLGMEDLGFKLK